MGSVASCNHATMHAEGRTHSRQSCDELDYMLLDVRVLLSRILNWTSRGRARRVWHAAW